MSVNRLYSVTGTVYAKYIRNVTDRQIQLITIYHVLKTVLRSKPLRMPRKLSMWAGDPERGRLTVCKAAGLAGC